MPTHQKQLEKNKQLKEKKGVSGLHCHGSEKSEPALLF